MSALPPEDDSDEAVLAELVAFDRAAVRRAHQRMMAAEEDAQFNDAGRTYQRLARSLRQSLALRERFRQGQERARRARAAADGDDLTPEQEALEAAAERRVLRVRGAATRAVWDEAEPPEREFLLSMIDERLTFAHDRARLFDQDEDAHVESLCADLRQRLARWRERGGLENDTPLNAPRAPEPALAGLAPAPAQPWRGSG